MKKIIFILVCTLLVSNAFSQVNSRSVYVNGYYKSNGTYVEGHYRTAPNNTINDNYSTYPNVNPYTGVQGTRTPDYYSTPTYSNQSIYSSPNNSSRSNYTTPSYQNQSIYSTPRYSTPSYTTPSTYNTSRRIYYY